MTTDSKALRKEGDFFFLIEQVTNLKGNMKRLIKLINYIERNNLKLIRPRESRY